MSCTGWLKCWLAFEKEEGNHDLVVSRVIHAECGGEFMEGKEFNVSRAKPVLEIRDKRFTAAERLVHVKESD